MPLRGGVGLVEDVVDGVRELLPTETRCGRGGAVLVTLRTEGFDGVRVEGKEDREV